MSLDTCQPCPRYLQGYPRGGWAGERAGYGCASAHKQRKPSKLRSRRPAPLLDRQSVPVRRRSRPAMAVPQRKRNEYRLLPAGTRSIVADQSGPKRQTLALAAASRRATSSPPAHEKTRRNNRDGLFSLPACGEGRIGFGLFRRPFRVGARFGPSEATARSNVRRFPESPRRRARAARSRGPRRFRCSCGRRWRRRASCEACR